MTVNAWKAWQVRDHQYTAFWEEQREAQKNFEMALTLQRDNPLSTQDPYGLVTAAQRVIEVSEKIKDTPGCFGTIKFERIAKTLSAIPEKDKDNPYVIVNAFATETPEGVPITRIVDDMKI